MQSILVRNRAFLKPAALVVAILALLAGFGLFVPASSPAAHVAASGPAAPQSRALSQIETDLPPLLLSVSPTEDQAWDGGPVTLTFDQPLNPGAAMLLTLAPDLPGETVVDGERLIFTPSAAPEPGVRYRLRLDSAATSVNGVHFASPVEVTVVAPAPLTVTSTQPRDGAAEVDTTGQLLIVFNRPVVALGGVDEQAGFPSPITISPAIEGAGRWLNTSVYSFRPTLAWAGATEYRVTVDAVSAVDGSALPAPHVFSFTTAAPIVTEAMPSGLQVRPDSVVTVFFSQAMDRASTEAAFRLVKDGGEAVAGEFGWLAEDRTLVFTPTEWLDFGAQYTFSVTAGAQPAGRAGTLRTAFSRSFQVVPLPGIANVSPLDGTTEVSPDASVVIRFTSPVSPALLGPNIQVSPLLTTTRVYSYYSEYLNELQLSWFKEPNTTYTVRLGAAIGDEYGNTLGQDYELRFTTGDYAPFIRLEAERFTHFAAYTDTRLSVLYRNVGSVDVKLFRLPDSELLRLLSSEQWQVWEDYQGPDPAANLIWSRSYDTAEDRNVTIRQVITLTNAAGDRLPPGAYYVQVAQPPGAIDTGSWNDRSRTMVVLSNHNLTFKRSERADSLVWLTDLLTGQPIAGQPVRFFHEGALLGEGVTNGDGLLRIKVTPTGDRYWGPVLAMVGSPGDRDFALVSSDWNNGIAVYDFQVPGVWSLDSIQAHFYTERPIYRPGQTVYWKGIVRSLINDVYQMPPADLRVSVTIRDPQGNVLSEESLPLGPHGTLHGSIQLTDEALTGPYFLEAMIRPDETTTVYAGANFIIAAYRKPEFEITVTPDRPDYKQGDTVRVKVQANYFSGGPLVDSPVTWRIISEPYFFNWENGLQDRWYNFSPYDPDAASTDPFGGLVYLGLIREGRGVTGPDGSFMLELPADIADAPQSQRWMVDVTVQSPTNQFVSAQTRFPIHKAAYYIGISPDSYVGMTGEPYGMALVTVAPDGTRFPNAEVQVVIAEQMWNSVYARNADGMFRWETTVQRTPVFTTTVTTDAQGDARVTWTPEVGGQYMITAVGFDDAGNRTASMSTIWVSAADPSGFVAWPRANNDRIQLIADKIRYEPGDTARILVPSPFIGPVRALLTVERSGVVSAQVIELTGNSETIELPITEEHVPNIFVSVVIVKGEDETNPTPAMRIGYAQLVVDTGAKALTIDINSSSATVEPGATVAYTLTVTNQAGEPVADAELSVAIVDRAVLALAPEPDRPLIEVFYYQRPIGVMTSALLTINQDRMSRQLSEGAKGGGGGDGFFGMDVRQEFPDIAFWRADLTTDANGVATFGVTLPDNLTTWRLVTKGVTDDVRVGNAIYDVVATKELQVRPILPRFFTAGDQAQIGAAILNTTGFDLENGLVSLQLSGASITDNSEPVQEFAMGAGSQIRAGWPIAVDTGAASVVVTITAVADTSAGDALFDGVALTIPVKRYEARETVATSGIVPPGGTAEAIRLPAAAGDQGELLITLEPSLAAGMLDGLRYLAEYPYACNEQLVSRFLPNVFTVRALEQLGHDNAELRAGLETNMADAVQRLIARQNQDGGWGYWPNERSSAFITAYILWGLAEAQDQGATIPARTIQNAVEYLDRNFLAPSQVQARWLLNEMAFMHFVLAKVGHGDPGRAGTLYDARERLGIYGKAYLAMALHTMQTDTGDRRVDTLLDDLFAAAKVTGTTAWWQEDATDFRTLNTDTRSTAVALAAFMRSDPDNPLLTQVVRWLMQTRQGGYWSTTQETAWALIALTDWLTYTGELAGDYSWDVTLNGDELGSGVVTSTTMSERIQLRAEVADLVRNAGNALRFGRQGEQGRLYYTTYLRYFLDATEVPARDRGIVVDRRFALASDTAAAPVSQARVGDVISVTVTIVAPTDLFHLLVETPIPAGTEPVDPNLATTSDFYDYPSLEVMDDGSPTWWRFWSPTYTDIRDDKVVLFATFLQAGTYEYTFNVQATVGGNYNVLPAYAEQMFFPEVWGSSTGATFRIVE